MKDYQEPEVVAYGSVTDYGDYEVHTYRFVANADELITMKSHREAMAEWVKFDDWLRRFDEKCSELAKIDAEIEQKDTALQACIDALGTCRVMAKDSAGNYTREVTPNVIVDALAKAKEAMK